MALKWCSMAASRSILKRYESLSETSRAYVGILDRQEILKDDRIQAEQDFCENV